MILRIIFAVLFAAILSYLAIGCASQSQSVTISYRDQHYQPPAYGYQPIIKASINGVSGYFVIDTGAMGPVLNSTAARRCGIAVMPSEGYIIGAGSGNVSMMQATNITVKFSQGFVIHWPLVLVLQGELATPAGTNDNFFGILDYRTLRANHAVLDMKNKTITFTK
jgi:hypothetical protein